MFGGKFLDFFGDDWRHLGMLPNVSLPIGSVTHEGKGTQGKKAPLI